MPKIPNSIIQKYSAMRRQARPLMLTALQPWLGKNMSHFLQFSSSELLDPPKANRIMSLSFLPSYPEAVDSQGCCNFMYNRCSKM